MEERERAQVSEEVLEGLALDDGDEVVAVDQGVVAHGQTTAHDGAARKPPGVAFLAGDSDCEPGPGARQPDPRPALPHGLLRLPKDLLVLLRRSALVRPREEEKVALFVPASLQHHRETTSAALQGDDGDALHLVQDLARFRRILLPKAEDIAVGRRPAVLDSECQPGIVAFEDAQPVGEAIAGAALHNPQAYHHRSSQQIDATHSGGPGMLASALAYPTLAARPSIGYSGSSLSASTWRGRIVPKWR